MAEYIGRSSILSFAAVVLNTKYRSISLDESVAMIDKSSGADTHMSHIAGLREGTVSVDVVMDGTTVWDAVAPGTTGEIIYGPEGSTTGKPKYTADAIVTSRSRTNPYNDLVVATIEFTMQEAWAATTYA